MLWIPSGLAAAWLVADWLARNRSTRDVSLASVWLKIGALVLGAILPFALYLADAAERASSGMGDLILAWPLLFLIFFGLLCAIVSVVMLLIAAVLQVRASRRLSRTVEQAQRSDGVS